MAEYCLDCWNTINGTRDKKRKYIMSKGLDLCEGCGEYKRVVIVKRKYYYYRRFKYILLPLYVIGRILILPYLLYKDHNMQKGKTTKK